MHRTKSVWSANYVRVNSVGRRDNRPEQPFSGRMIQKLDLLIGIMPHQLILFALGRDTLRARPRVIPFMHSGIRREHIAYQMKLGKIYNFWKFYLLFGGAALAVPKVSFSIGMMNLYLPL
jgi:hypothetical protein